MRRVVVIGGGYAGLHAYRSLSRRLGRRIRRDEASVVLVTRDPYHTYHGWTGEVLSGRVDVEDTLSPLRPILGDALLEAEVREVDIVHRHVHVLSTDGKDVALGYDHLIVASGSADPLDLVPGAREHAWRLKDTRDMQEFVRRLSTIRPVSIAVVGGGMAGVETASALSMRDFGGTRPEVHLVSGSESLLPSLRPHLSRLADAAYDVLLAQGVRVHTGSRTRSIDPAGIDLDDGRRLEADVVVMAAGISFPSIPGLETLPRTEEGRLRVGPDLRVLSTDDVWAAGDVAYVLRPGSDVACPVDALWAMKQGEHAGRNVARVLKGDHPRPFVFKGMGQAAGLGGEDAVAELYGLQFTGGIARLLRIGFFAWYMPSRRKAGIVLRKLLRRRVDVSDGGARVDGDADTVEVS